MDYRDPNTKRTTSPNPQKGVEPKSFFREREGERETHTHTHTHSYASLNGDRMCDAAPAERGECQFHGFQQFWLEIQAPAWQPRASSWVV